MVLRSCNPRSHLAWNSCEMSAPRQLLAIVAIVVNDSGPRRARARFRSIPEVTLHSAEDVRQVCFGIHPWQSCINLHMAD